MSGDLLNDVLAGTGVLLMAAGIGWYFTSLPAVIVILGAVLLVVGLVRAWRQVQGPESR